MRLSIFVMTALALAGCQRAEEAASLVEPKQATAGDPPLAKTVTDRTLQWGACPPVFPAGCEIAVLHGDPAKPNADVFFRVPGGYAIPAHRHSSAERMILVTGQARRKISGCSTGHTVSGKLRLRSGTIAPQSDLHGGGGLHFVHCVRGAGRCRGV